MDRSSSGKVLFATFDVIPDPTGTSAQTTRTLQGLTAFHEVEVLSAKTPEHAHIERYFGARLLRVPIGQGDLRDQAEAFSRAVRRQLQSEEYDLVHFTDPFGGYPICELRSALGSKLVYEARAFPSIEVKYLEPELETDLAFITRMRRQEIFCLSNADVVLVPSSQTREYVLSLGVAPEKIHVHRPMVDKAPLGALPPPEGAPCRVLYLGSHASWQGIPSLLFALRFAMKREVMKVRVIGPTHGSWQRQLQEMIREFGLRDHVTLELPVPHEDIPSILAQTDVVVAPLQKGDRNQEQGACPMKLAEAMSAGRCIITADLPITREILEHEVSGLLYPPSDEDALGDLLVKAARDVKLRCRLGAVAQATSGDFDALERRASLLHHYARLLQPEVEVERSVFRRAIATGPEARPGDETTQPKGESPEGPTSTANLEELRARVEQDARPPDAAELPTGPSARPVYEPEESTGPRLA
ncbi:MAG: glycosyltransferase family 4 protein, partial [Deltaproteobacteria bacterium]|nr:glycosyltransferase family 4 protein [Deltaproteobacteria bacterium]